MEKPKAREIMDYVADMAEQLARFCQSEAPATAVILIAAARSAREAANKRTR